MRRLFLLVLVLALVADNALPVWGQVSEGQLQEINQQWQSSVHALAEVNCSTCHQTGDPQGFVISPSQESCQSCHSSEVETFLLGKHGVRLLEDLTPLSPAMARLPMKPESLDRQMTCNTCHNVHSVNTQDAAVDACLTCHNDRHSLNYSTSKHAQMFVAEGPLPRPSSQSVTCATCHLPRQRVQEAGSPTVMVNHNNTFTLKPRDRMVKEVCMNCHGLGFAWNSIFDNALVEANFSHPPTLNSPSLEMVHQLEKRRSGSLANPDGESASKGDF